MNLAELYFESLEGAGNPARFTPMNDDVRRNSAPRTASIPSVRFSSPRNERQYAGQALSRFPRGSGRAPARRMDRRGGDACAAPNPDLDLVLTHVDDRFDPSMREKIGADVTRMLPLLASHELHFSDRRPGHHLESWAAALSADRRALQAADAARNSSPSTST